jgi:hypothetical protein
MDPQTLYDSLNGGAPPDAVPTDYADLLGYSSPQAPAEPAIPATPVAPSPIAAPVPTPGLAPGQAVGAGVSQTGYSPGAYHALQANHKGATGLDAKAAQDEATSAAPYAQVSADQHAAGDLAQHAAIQEAQIESQKIVATSEAKQKIAAANTDFLTKEQAAIDNAKTEADTAHSQYRAALMDYAAAKVNPAQLWDAGGMSGQFAMLATAFGHDFLGAKGIQTSGLDSINKAIQNNINAQLEAMRKKGDVAAGFKQLWDMQRQQSASDTEARQRMNGFYLAALSNQIEATLGGYDSQLALAKGQAAKAALMQEQVKNDFLVRKQIDETTNSRAQRRIQVYGIDVGASTAKYTADAHMKAAQIAASAKDKSSPLDGVIFDTSKTGNNQAIRRFLPDVKPEERNKLREQTAKTLDTVKNVEHLIELQDQIDKTPPGDIGVIKRMQSERQRVAELVRNTTKMGIIYDNSGKQINEQEVKLYDEIVSKKDWFTNGDNTRALGTLAKQMLDKNNSIMGAVSTEISPGDPAYGFSSGTKGFDEGNATLSDIQSAEGAGKPQDTKGRQFQKWALSPNATESVDLSELPDAERPGISHAWEAFKKDQPWAAPQSDTDTSRRQGGSNPLSNPLAGDATNPDRAFVNVERIANLAVGGDASAKATLDQWAGGKPSTADIGGLLAAYAQWEKAQKGI